MRSGERPCRQARRRPASPRLLIERLEDRTVPSFLPPVNYATDANPRSAVVGDFNGDGVLDVAVVNGDSNTVNVFLGNGDATFQAARSMPIGTNPLSAAVGDFNGDGKLDLVVSDDYAGGPVLLLVGNGDGTFQAPINVFSDPSFTPLSVAVGALQKNGQLDLVITGQVSSSTGSFGEVVVLAGDGHGSFAQAASLPVGTFPNSVVLGDFNNDGTLDAAVTDSALGTVDVLLGKGDGTLAPPVSFATGAPADTTIADYYLAAGDFNGDGKLDIVAANRGNNTVSVLLGKGDGTFQTAVTYPVGASGPQSVAVGDFSQDGELDIVAANVDDNKISVLLGNGDGTFSTPVIYTTGAGANSVAVAEFNGHFPDLAVTNWISKTLSILVAEAPGLAASAAPLGPLVEGNAFSGLVATFTNPDATNSATINWGDGTTSTGTITANSIDGYNVSGSHTFADEAATDIAVTITDSSGNLATVHAGPVGWWRGEANALDSTGNNPGTIQGNVTFAPGQVGQAFSFDGSGGSVAVGGPGTIAGARTITAWVYPHTNTDYGLPIMTGGITFAGDFFGIAGTSGTIGDTQQYELYVDHWGTGIYHSGITVTPDAWDFVAMTYDGGSTVRFYINAVAGEAASGPLYDYSLNTYMIGGNTIGGTTTKSTFNGLLDEVTLYNQALSAADIQELYNAQRAGAAQPVPIGDAPLTATGASVTAAMGIPVTATVASFTDANPNATAADFSASITWGDGQSSTGTVASNGQGGFNVTGTHSYATVGSYTAGIAIADRGGSTATAAAPITVVPVVLSPTLAVDLVSSSEYFTNLVSAFYQQVLHRQPDLAGAAFWVSQLQHGMTDEQLEANLLNSTEYITDHGGGGSTWVTGVYNDLLGRAPDAGGLQAWTTVMAAGESFFQVALAFATSAEREAQRITQDYQLFLGRSPSAAEVSVWVNGFEHALTNEAIIVDFLGSPEFFSDQGGNAINWFPGDYRALFGQSAATAVNSVPSYLPGLARDLMHSPLHYAQVITAAYQDYLGRQPDAVGLAGWLALMENGLTDGQLAAAILSSSEYLQDHGGLGAGWVEALYQDVLGRTPSASEVNGWVQALNSGVTPAAVALTFVTSSEREGQLVTRDYEQFLGRSPGSAESGSWVNAFENGVLTNEDIVAGFVGSAEYFQDNGSAPGKWWTRAVTTLFG
jgi:hypothetical protein